MFFIRRKRVKLLYKKSVMSFFSQYQTALVCLVFLQGKHAVLALLLVS